MAARRAQRILIPTDFSHESMTGLHVAACRARKLDHHLLLLYVRSPHECKTVASDAMAYQQLSRLSCTLRSRGIRITPLFGRGRPAEEIVETALKERADLIVMSTRRDATHAGMGTTAWVMANAPCEVWRVVGKQRQRPQVQACIHRSIPVRAAG